MSRQKIAQIKCISHHWCTCSVQCER